MKEKIFALLENLNNSNQLVLADVNDYVDKIYSKAKIINYMYNDDLIGFIAFYDNDKTKKEAYLTMLAVDPSFHKMGYGKILIKNAIEYLILNKFSSFKLEVRSNNLSAIKLYETFDFKVTQTVNESQYMIKEL